MLTHYNYGTLFSWLIDSCRYNRFSNCFCLSLTDPGTVGGNSAGRPPQQRVPGKAGTVSSPSSVKPGSALPTTGQYLVSPPDDWSVQSTDEIYKYKYAICWWCVLYWKKHLLSLDRPTLGAKWAQSWCFGC